MKHNQTYVLCSTYTYNGGVKVLMCRNLLATIWVDEGSRKMVDDSRVEIYSLYISKTITILYGLMLEINRNCVRKLLPTYTYVVFPSLELNCLKRK